MLAYLEFVVEFAAPATCKQQLVNSDVLTYMATIEQLEEDGVLIKISVLDDAEVEKREIYVFPAVRSWIHDTLPGLQAFDPDDTPPLHQAWSVFRAFAIGDELEEGDEYRLMQPEENDVYELKSPDTRFYGWFVRPGIFIAVCADSMERVHTYNLASGYRGEVERARDNIDLDPPKYLAGASKEDVFSV
ncbi:hypothetical protein [Rhizobium ruizarguesonis]|jgi:hypothetical protein|uniref:hypothetical protein n=1 Tax=Rhizobium ruizarguesonis TaxID=2081791 RepID=UPI001031168C|nr:hypothetical protein [Rhizobium ruizarguesonis]TAT82478.1 hypothetical protein ELI52_02685 [Rhizobium ruizarguesonis]